MVSYAKNTLFRSSALAALAFAGISAPAIAQDQPGPVGAQSTQARTDGEVIDEARAAAGQGVADQGGDIVVTGSRIRSPTITSVAPVQVISDALIRQAGVTNIQEVLLENPAFGSPALSRANSAFLTSGTGVASIDLRNLGTARTLLLINGRRVVAGVPGSATVDLNVIPAQFLARTDVLTGGASTLYGSDAVAGVVNFIYKSDFEGIEANAQYGLAEAGDDRRYQANVTVGGNFADDRGNVMVHFGYSSEGQVLSRNRRGTFTDNLDAYAAGGFTNPALFQQIVAPTLSGIVPQGTFVAGGRTFTYDLNNGSLRPCFSANGGAAPANCGLPAGTQIGPDGFNRQFFRTIAVPVERYLLASRVRYDVTDDVRFFGEANFANTRSSRIIEPFPLQSNGPNGIFPASNGAFELDTIVNGVAVRNPLVPAAIYNAATDTNGNGIRDIQFGRRLSEFGTRNGQTNRDFYRFVVGLEGAFGAEQQFNWDVSYNYGRTSESQQSNGQVNVLNFRNALAVIPNPAVGGVGTVPVGTPICADANARAQGCVPINIFGLGSVSPEAVRYIAADQTLQTRITQQQVQANVSGSLIDLPGGPLGFAVGVEYRKETSFANNDALTNAGLNAGNALPDTQGEFDVREAYAELNVPLISDSFVHYLGLRGSGRVSDYSTVGTIYTYSGSAEFAPIEAIRFTGGYARSVRAPNIGELFTGPSQTFPTGLTDPCVGVGATGGGVRGDICRASPGVAANIAANGTFTITQLDLQGISGFNSGNPNLGEETSESYTASAIIAPRQINALRNLVLRVDYYNIRVQDAIVSPPRQFLLSSCFNGTDTSLCSFIVRRPAATAINSSGSIQFVNAGAVNGGRLKSEGIDVTVTNTIPLGGIGWSDAALNMRVAYTHLLELSNVPLPGAVLDPIDGEVGAARDRFTANLGVSTDVFSLAFTGTYFGRSFLDNQFLVSRNLAPESLGVGSRLYIDAQASVKAADAFELYFGADNLFDRQAPLILSGIPGNTTGTNTNASVYDVFGRRFYVGARLRF